MTILSTGLSIILLILSGIAGLLVLILICPIVYDLHIDCKELSYKKINGELKVKIMFFILAFNLLKMETEIDKYISILFLRFPLSDETGTVKKFSNAEKSDKKADKVNSKNYSSKSDESDKHVKSSEKSFDSISDDIDDKKEYEFTDFCDFLSNFSKKTQDKMIAVIKKIKAVLKKKDRLIKLYENEKTGKAFTKARLVLSRTLRHISPKRISGSFLIGFEAPDITGKVYGMYSLIDEYLRTDLIVTPDFDNEVFCGKIRICGRIVPIYVILYTLRLVFDKDIKTTFKRAKKILGG